MLEMFLHLIHNERCRLYNTMNDSTDFGISKIQALIKNSKFELRFEQSSWSFQSMRRVLSFFKSSALYIDTFEISLLEDLSSIKSLRSFHPRCCDVS
jgi:hypothetical protein